MAKTLKSFSSLHTGYPWDRWANGSAWEVEHRRDFNVEPKMFRYTLYSKARRIDKKVRISLDGNTVRFQFYKPSASRKAKPAKSR